MRGNDLRRLVAPAAFLLAATVAVLLIRSGMHAGGAGQATTVVVPSAPHKKVAGAAAKKTKPKKKPPASAARYWTVQAGDTFGVISTKTGVSVATIEQLNPNTQSTALFIGEKIRIR